jgi:DNA repair and recombination protein RAD54B
MAHLDAITDRVVNKNGWGPVARIDGSVPSDRRQAIVDAFNRQPTHNNSEFIMLLSTKAGGVGINL